MTKHTDKRIDQEPEAVVAELDRTIAEVMLDWTRSPKKKRRKIAENYWDRYESGAPMSSDDV